MKKLIVALLVLGTGYWVQHAATDRTQSVVAPSNTYAPATRGDDTLNRAYERQLSNVQVEGEGKVIKVLKDDDEGSRHQRFLLEMPSGQTILIAHNIDLAPRIATLREGDRVAFHGEYEWNDKGGVIHWTHRDPNHRHVDGWLDHNGHRYQ